VSAHGICFRLVVADDEQSKCLASICLNSIDLAANNGVLVR
jgi:hypothetical protein